MNNKVVAKYWEADKNGINTCKILVNTASGWAIYIDVCAVIDEFTERAVEEVIIDLGINDL